MAAAGTIQGVMSVLEQAWPSARVIDHSHPGMVELAPTARQGELIPVAAWQSESGREALYEEVLNGSVQLDALVRDIELLGSLRSDKVFRQVQLGAVVKTDCMNFLVAVSQPRFRVADEDYMGVSTESPFLHQAQGMIRGDAFTVVNRTYLIKEIF